jgi:hypothetical protein
MGPIEGSETSAHRYMTPGKYPEEHTKYSEHGESLKSRIAREIFSRTQLVIYYCKVYQLATCFDWMRVITIPKNVMIYPNICYLLNDLSQYGIP